MFEMGKIMVKSESSIDGNFDNVSVKIKSEPQEVCKSEVDAIPADTEMIDPLVKQEAVDKCVKLENEIKLEYEDLHSVIEDIKVESLETVKVPFKPLETTSVPKEFKCKSQLRSGDFGIPDRIEDKINKDKPSSYLKSLHSNSSFVCNTCQYKTEVKQRFKKHLSIHESTKSFICDICYFKTVNRHYLYDHMKIHDLRNRSKRFTSCPHCHRILRAKKSNMSRHLEICKVKLVNEGIPLPERKSNLTIKNKDAEKIYKCDNCDYSCAFKCGLGNHIKSHSDKTLKCDQCNYTTSRQPEFSLHILIHAGKEPYECEVCGYQAAFKQNLRRHVLKHSDIQPFKCDQCPYTTHRKHYLTSHMGKHTRKKKTVV